MDEQEKKRVVIEGVSFTMFKALLGAREELVSRYSSELREYDEAIKTLVDGAAVDAGYERDVGWQVKQEDKCFILTAPAIEEEQGDN